jgi:hypothetical protein
METLEEVAKKQWGNVHRTGVLGFIEGAKWQAERMYSEEEVIEIVKKSRATGLTAEYLILTEQFKKQKQTIK